MITNKTLSFDMKINLEILGNPCNNVCLNNVIIWVPLESTWEHSTPRGCTRPRSSTRGPSGRRGRSRPRSCGTCLCGTCSGSSGSWRGSGQRRTLAGRRAETRRTAAGSSPRWWPSSAGPAWWSGAWGTGEACSRLRMRSPHLSSVLRRARNLSPPTSRMTLCFIFSAVRPLFLARSSWLFTIMFLARAISLGVAPTPPPPPPFFIFAVLTVLVILCSHHAWKIVICSWSVLVIVTYCQVEAVEVPMCIQLFKQCKQTKV